MLKRVPGSHRTREALRELMEGHHSGLFGRTEIITRAPNVMWGTDGVRVFTVEDGWGWIFTAVEHWNSECVGWHVCKRGDRFAAAQPISMGLANLHGSTALGVAITGALIALLLSIIGHLLVNPVHLS